jgi:hypothetical protein
MPRADPKAHRDARLRDTLWSCVRLGDRAPCVAQRAGEIPLPEDDLMVRADVYAFGAIDEQAVCASWTGKKPEAFSCGGACWPYLTSPTVIEAGLRVTATFVCPP